MVRHLLPMIRCDTEAAPHILASAMSTDRQEISRKTGAWEMCGEDESYAGLLRERHHLSVFSLCAEEIVFQHAEQPF